MDRKLYKALCQVSEEKIDELYQIAINNPSKFRHGKIEAISRRWHELHDSEVKGV
jgi:hypothetical protein